MLDQLVESKNNSKESVRLLEFLSVIGIIAVMTLLSAWTYSLFTKDYGMGAGDLELSTLVAPPPPDEEPPKPEVKQEEKRPLTLTPARNSSSRWICRRRSLTR